MSIQYILIIISLLASFNLWAKELKLCGVEWPPFTYGENNRLVKGISIDVYKEAFPRMEMKFTADQLPWARCLKDVEDGYYDAVIDNANLPPYIVADTPTSVYPLGIYVRNDFPQDKFSWDSITGKSVAMVTAYDYTKKIAAFTGWKRVDFASDEKVLQALQLKRYNYALIDVFSAPILSKKVGIEIKLLKPVVDSTNLYLAFSPKNSHLVKQFDEAIKVMIKEGIMDIIYRKYISMSYSEVLKLSQEAQ
ncbi:transporter substrate-binding domain-containing protein [Endozoicomonas sp. SM1973]|uniref:Transporter substrate-binding domain-containing protein n=1 Tax=Spartinivicinus marinus TaxID=2994442 RepID=A0A853I3P0_9GAMM|nr:transporter substrate-binding domain-containing protein [Spartinivicinus marinus]MCX4027746.1 transporter substrate-binding domain-containing protein [Spartinivicinus marinus]NYZ68550.1 transporter substrate-binding domain-containing protein [Spartinivicinus marinus]